MLRYMTVSIRSRTVYISRMSPKPLTIRSFTSSLTIPARVDQRHNPKANHGLGSDHAPPSQVWISDIYVDRHQEGICPLLAWPHLHIVSFDPASNALQGHGNGGRLRYRGLFLSYKGCGTPFVHLPLLVVVLVVLVLFPGILAAGNKCYLGSVAGHELRAVDTYLN